MKSWNDSINRSFFIGKKISNFLIVEITEYFYVGGRLSKDNQFIPFGRKIYLTALIQSYWAVHWQTTF